MMAGGRPTSAALLTFGFVTFALLWGGFLGLRQIEGVGSILDGVEFLTVDWRYWLAGPRPAPRGVVIVAIDDETIRRAGAYPLPRTAMAQMVRTLAASSPRAIAIDIAFLDPGPADTDAQLAEALHSAKSVIAAIGLFDGEDAQRLDGKAGELALIPKPTSILWPAAAFGAVAEPGLVNISTDSNGVPRFIPMIYRTREGVVPSFALAAVATALDAEPAVGSETVDLAGRIAKLDLGRHLPIRYYGPRGSIRRLSASRVLGDALDADAVRGQIVVLGATALGVGDTFATPFDRSVPGVEVFATGIGNLLEGGGLIRTTLIRKIDAAAAMLLPSLTVLLMGMRRVLAGITFAALAIGFWLALIFAAFVAGYWFSVAVPLAALVPVAVGYGAARLGLDRILARRLAADRAALSNFQSPLLVDHIMKNPGFLERPVGQDVAVVFLDLSGFTGLAERAGPEWTREMLSAFQSLIERTAMKHDGYVVGFMGDGAMIVFGLPAPRRDDAARALLAVVDLHDAIVAWLESLPPLARDRLSVRIGGHFGAAVVSRLGSARHQHITATGDTVNVASRLLEAAKQQRCRVIVSEDLAAAAATAPEAAPALEIEIRGRERPLKIRILR